jgi:hypothetical protein
MSILGSIEHTVEHPASAVNTVAQDVEHPATAEKALENTTAGQLGSEAVGVVTAKSKKQALEKAANLGNNLQNQESTQEQNMQTGDIPELTTSKPPL